MCRRQYHAEVILPDVASFLYLRPRMNDELFPEPKINTMHIIENEYVRVSINDLGAELNSIYSKPFKIEYMWNGDPAFWSKQSPVLFPIVGGLKDNSYFFEGQKYHLPRHGFAREKRFTVSEQSKESISFSLSDNDDTRQNYPFAFQLTLRYTVVAKTLRVDYVVKNPGTGLMYFSIGGHPAFKVPLVEGGKYDDHYLELNQKETSRRWVVSREGLIDANSESFLTDESVIPLKKELFFHDALVFKDLVSNEMALKSTKHNHGLNFIFTGFPFMGIWAAKNADFVCIEPWCGIADSVDTDQDFTKKEGIISLPADQSFHRQWSVTVF
jgi:galactose mutarotase-like enzyme